MRHSHVFRRRLTVAVSVALAMTAAAPAAAAPAPASAPALASATGAEDQAVVPFPLDSEIVGAGSTGFLTLGRLGQMWTTFADGTATTLPSSGHAYGAQASDAVVVQTGNTLTLKDMTTGTTVLSVDPTTYGSGALYGGAVGSTLLVRTANGPDGEDVHLLDRAGDKVSDRKVTGLPANAVGVFAEEGTSGEALLTYRTGRETTSKKYWALLDLATGVVSQTQEIVAPARCCSKVALSATHVAWVEYRSDSDTRVVVLERATGARQDIRLGRTTSALDIGLVGQWVTYGQFDGFASYEPHVLNSVTARDLGTGTTRKLLDHVKSSATAPDGTQLVRGGTVADGEGLYRIASGADGTPVAALVATTGRPTKVALRGNPSVPAVVELDLEADRARMTWPLSRFNVLAEVTLRHTRTGATTTEHVNVGAAPDGSGLDAVADVEWPGTVSEDGRVTGAAPNGAYTWTLTAKPQNGIGPNLVASGSFTVTRKPAPHDYTDNGSPDLLRRDSSGRLWRDDTMHLPWGDSEVYLPKSALIGSGWGGYDQIEAVGNIAGAAHADIVARDRSGVLWHYLGKGDGTFDTRYKIGTGWGGYNKITGGSDLNSDGKPDLLATDAAGAVWLHKGTGSWRTPFAARVKLGTGWHGYNQITATGNIAGAPAGDLVGRDTAGVLWLHLGKGDGTFAPRIRIGAGWGGYNQLVAVGDADRDGRPDLVARRNDGPAYVYKGTGSWSAPFRAPEEIGGSWGTVSSHNHLA
ncbi:FG-GAP repeat domain-containing protein [Streptomyces sp. NPDC059875]|uniref:FG-GAP repeat domain-containing protein n=1 Tax=unclassified Streptomyces TaxID=2593676 RepID=UPI003663A714